MLLLQRLDSSFWAQAVLPKQPAEPPAGAELKAEPKPRPSPKMSTRHSLIVERLLPNENASAEGKYLFETPRLRFKADLASGLS